MKMLRRVPVGRLIAATGVTASSADPQMEPWITQFKTFLASEGTRNPAARGSRRTSNGKWLIPRSRGGLVDDAQYLEASEAR